MNLLEILRQFKTIKPDSSFSEKSKRAILASPQNIPARPFAPVFRFLETGVAVVLAGFFILLITGAFSNSTYIAPVQYSVIDVAGLHAEAQAIDMQIELANVNYPESSVAPQSTAFAAAATSSDLSTSMMAATSSASAVAAMQSSTASSTSSSTVSVDQALEQLSK